MGLVLFGLLFILNSQCHSNFLKKRSRKKESERETERPDQSRGGSVLSVEHVRTKCTRCTDLFFDFAGSAGSINALHIIAVFCF